MRISISDNGLIVESVTDLRLNQSSQLKFWGFIQSKEISTIFINSKADPKEILPRLLEFLDEEKLNYSLSEDCQMLVTQRQVFVSKIDSIRKLAGEFKDGKVELAEFSAFRKFVESQIQRRLKEHQLKAAYHLYITGNGANFSVPGSGKTTVVLTVYEKLKQEGRVNFLFIVGPPACFGPWKNEFFETLGRKPSAKTLAGGDRDVRRNDYYNLSSSKVDMYLTTFQTLYNDLEQIKAFFNRVGVLPLFVVDEAHYIKQQNGIWAKAVLEASIYCPVKCVLTGTPIPNRYTDIFNLFDLLWGNDEIICSDEKIQIQAAEQSNNTRRAQELMRNAVSPFFYRVRKKDLNLKGQIFLEPYTLKMNKTERDLYDAIQTKIRTYTREDFMSNIDIVQRLHKGRMMRLRQCISYPKMIRTVIEGYDENLIDSSSKLWRWIVEYDRIERPAKLEFLLNLVKRFQLTGEKIVIWSNFIETIELISTTLLSKGFMNKCIYGKTPTEKAALSEEETRESIRNEFVDPGSGLDILIANPAACAESISLHRTCQNAIYYDLSYNCAQYLQSLDRIHRVGGSENKEAIYHFLQYENTIDKDIKRTLEAKAQRMFQLIDEDFSIYSLDMFEEDNEELDAYERLFGN